MCAGIGDELAFVEVEQAADVGDLGGEGPVSALDLLFDAKRLALAEVKRARALTSSPARSSR